MFNLDKNSCDISTYMVELIKYLNERTKEYDEGHPTISDKEWDEAYFELEQLEQETGIYYPNSPTHSIIYTTVNNLKKSEHNHKMLSLDKTKNLDEIESFLGDKDFVAMAKMDGLTCSLTYSNGELVKAETRGNGLIGEDVTHNAMVVSSIPKKISILDEVIVDGEVICTYKDFEPFSNQYKNPRNFASGSIRLLNSKECAARNLTFIAWDLIKGDKKENNSFKRRLITLAQLGFEVVPWIQENLAYAVQDIQDLCKQEGYPIDGLVFKFDNISYGNSLGETDHHFKNAIAYKFYDEEYETRLFNIEWSMGRTGILTPVAVFEPVDDGDSVIERASLHNLNIMRETLGDYPHKGQKIWVCKQNAIIPQVVRAEKSNLGHYYEDDLVSPSICPICGQPTAINESEQLYCTNPDCDGKFLNKIDHFCGKKGLDIKGISKATLEKLIDKGWINNFVDVFHLKEHEVEWKQLPGFGTKSVDRILTSIENARTTNFESFIAAIGIPLVGKTVAKELIKNGITTYEDLKEKATNNFNFSKFNGFGPEKTAAICGFDFSMADEVFTELTFTSIELPKTNNSNSFSVVITGHLEKFKNREELKTLIEQNGGKVVTAVSSKVDCLINNNINSTSSKNISAKRLNIPIYSEEEFLKRYIKLS